MLKYFSFLISVFSFLFCAELISGELSPLHYAIKSEDWVLVDNLIDIGEDLNTYDLIKLSSNQKYFGPPSVRLVYKFNPKRSFQEKEMIISLLEKIILKGADLELRFNPCWGDTCKPGSCETTLGNFILVHSLNGYQYHKQWFQVSKMLLEKDLDPNFRYGRSGWIPMQFALQTPRLTQVELLLEYGSRLSNIDCFSWIGFNVDPEEFKLIVFSLIRGGVDPNLRSKRYPYGEISQLEQCILNLETKPVSCEFRREIEPFLRNLNY